jgi:superfamily II DNA or RNA helicase
MKTLYSHQQEIVDRNPAKHLIAFGTGVGKTLTALALADKNSVTPLIICPKALKENWARAVDDFDGLSATIVSKEEFRRDWDKLPAYRAVIIDEFHYFANLKSQMSKALTKYQRKNNPPFVWGLTATPYLSSPLNIHALAHHLGYQWNWWKFQMEYFNMVRMGARVVPVVKKGIEGKIADLVKSIGTTAKLEDLIDVPPQIEEVEYFALTAEQERAIKDINETDFIVRWTKRHQCENGVLYGGEYDDFKIKDFPCDKTDRIKAIVEENDKVAIFCRYNGQIEYLKGQLKDSGKEVFVINGQVKDRDSVVKQVEALDQCVVLINSSCSEGYELPSVGVIVFASLSFSFKDFVQSKGRFLRINKPKKNVYITLVSEGVDKDVYKCIQAKQDFNIAIFNN